jgi:hypothetical protein
MLKYSLAELQEAIDALQTIADEMEDGEPFDGDDGTRERFLIVLDAAREKARMIVPPVMR